MQITVFGANGKVGRLVVEQLLAEGHTVQAFVHRRHTLADHPALKVVQGDIHESDDITRAINGSDAVISALGSWHTPQKNILSSAMERLIPAMRAAHIQRIVTVTGAGAFTSHDRLTLFDKAQHVLFNTLAPKVLRDAEEHIRLLGESGLDWTSVRSPVMVESGSTAYALTSRLPLPWQTIHRRAVATCLVELTLHPAYHQAAPFIMRP